MKLSEIAKIIDVEFSADDIEITSMNTLKLATNTQLSFISNAKYVKDIEESSAGAILVDEKTKQFVPKNSIALISKNPYLSMAIISKYFAPLLEDNSLPLPTIGSGTTISPKAEIANGAAIGKNCTILAHAYVGANTRIGDNTIIYPNVTIYRDCIIGSNCIIHANTCIGSDGFGFATNEKGEHTKIYQNGNVVIEDDVEIGSNTSIDRAVFGSTTIKKGARLDNLIQIGHNCEVGEYSVMVSQSGLAGSTILGRNVVMGGQSATSGHITIAPFTKLGARSGVTKDIKSTGTYAGFPLFEHKQWLKLQAKIAKLIK